MYKALLLYPHGVSVWYARDFSTQSEAFIAAQEWLKSHPGGETLVYHVSEGGARLLVGRVG